MDYLDLDAWYAYYCSAFLLLKQSMRLELESFVVLLTGMCVILEQIVIISENVAGLVYFLNNLLFLCNVE